LAEDRQEPREAGTQRQRAAARGAAALVDPDAGEPAGADRPGDGRGLPARGVRPPRSAPQTGIRARVMPQSLNAWHFVSRAQTGGVPTLAFYADIPQNAVEWQYDTQGRLADDPLGGEPVQILRDSGTFPRRSGSFNLGALRGPQRAQDEANIRTAWWMG